MRFIELTNAVDGGFIVKACDVDIVFYDEEADTVVAVINGTATAIKESYEEARNILIPETK